LISSCGANVLAVTATRDWNTLAVMKAPAPKHPNRPTGDTSTASSLPMGINGFAVHPSCRLMLSVGRAERCLRLWNLITGKKAGVLNFHRDVLSAVGEGASRWSGEGRKVAWDGKGEQFVVGWEVGAVVFGQVCLSIAVTPAVANIFIRIVSQGAGQFLSQRQRFITCSMFQCLRRIHYHFPQRMVV
jgi:protein MAK11